MGLKDIKVITRVKIKLSTTFKIIDDIELISFYLGLKININCKKKTIKLSQLIYIEKILTKYHLDKAIIINTSIKRVTLKPNLFTKTI